MASEPLLSETRNSYSGAQTLNAIMNKIGATIDADFSKYARQLRENAVNNVQTLKLQDMDDLQAFGIPRAHAKVIVIFFAAPAAPAVAPTSTSHGGVNLSETILSRRYPAGSQCEILTLHPMSQKPVRMRANVTSWNANGTPKYKFLGNCSNNMGSFHTEIDKPWQEKMRPRDNQNPQCGVFNPGTGSCPGHVERRANWNTFGHTNCNNSTSLLRPRLFGVSEVPPTYCEMNLCTDCVNYTFCYRDSTYHMCRNCHLFQKEALQVYSNQMKKRLRICKVVGCLVCIFLMFLPLIISAWNF